MSYADAEYYKTKYQGTTVPENDLAGVLETVSMHIDSLTFNRIVGQGFSSLTQFQQDVVKKVCCMQADFEYENADEISSVLSGYSINGVSAQFGNSWNVLIEQGIAMRKDIYALLSQTGLCCRLVR